MRRSVTFNVLSPCLFGNPAAIIQIFCGRWPEKNREKLFFASTASPRKNWTFFLPVGVFASFEIESYLRERQARSVFFSLLTFFFLLSTARHSWKSRTNFTTGGWLRSFSNVDLQLFGSWGWNHHLPFVSPSLLNKFTHSPRQKHLPIHRHLTKLFLITRARYINKSRVLR